MIIEKNKSLKYLNSFGFDQAAEFYCEPSSIEELREAIAFAHNNKLPTFTLGGGSNIVLTQDVPGLTIRQVTKGIRYECGADQTLVQCDAGVNWHQLVLNTLDNDLYGIENLSLIPGDVGAAPIQNIGAYGVELCDVLTNVTALNVNTGELRTLQRDECNFGYRDSIFKHEMRNKFVITSIELKLNLTKELNLSYSALAAELRKRNLSEISGKDVSNVVCEIRKSKLPDPAVIGNAGSFFKNPIISTEHYQRLKNNIPLLPAGHYLGNEEIKLPAAWLIENAGWKGQARGGVGVHKLQALVMVHFGDATGKELIALAAEIRHSVHERFNILLEQEPLTI